MFKFFKSLVTPKSPYEQYIADLKNSPSFQEYQKKYPGTTIQDYYYVMTPEELQEEIKNGEYPPKKPPKECTCGHDCYNYRDYYYGLCHSVSVKDQAGTHTYNTDPPKSCGCDPDHNCHEYLDYYAQI